MKKRIKDKKAKQEAEKLRLAQLETEKQAAEKAEKDNTIIKKQIADRIKKGEERKIKLGLTVVTSKKAEPTPVFYFEVFKASLFVYQDEEAL